MSSKIHRMSDAEFSVWLENFESMLDDNLAALSLTTANLTEIQTLRTRLDGAIVEKRAAEEIKKGKTANLRKQRKAALKRVSFLSKILKANEELPVGLLEMLGLDLGGSRSASNLTPLPPDGLVVEGSSNGNNGLKWRKNGNKAGIFYIIEARLESEPKFTYVGSTSKTKFIHKNQKPGTRMFYRVKAQRSEEESPYSNEAVVY